MKILKQHASRWLLGAFFKLDLGFLNIWLFFVSLWLYWLIAKLVGVGINIKILGAATKVLLGLQLDAMDLGCVGDQLLVAVVTRDASRVLALVHLLLRVPTVMLPAVAARVEGLLAKVALERFLASVDSLVHLVVRFRVESASADFLDP